jgi:hypothetical protein
MSDDKIHPDARTVLPGRAVSYHNQGRQALIGVEPVADAQQLDVSAELVKWRSWAMRLLGCSEEYRDDDEELRNMINAAPEPTSADADRLRRDIGDLRLALRDIPPGGASGDAPVWIIRLHRAACEVAGIVVREATEALPGSVGIAAAAYLASPEGRADGAWRRSPPTLAEVRSGVWCWWNRTPDGTLRVVTFDIRDEWAGEPVVEHLETQVGYDFCVEFDPADPHWGGPDAEWAPCLPPPEPAP